MGQLGASTRGTLNGLVWLVGIDFSWIWGWEIMGK